MKKTELPVLVQRCLTHQIQILPFQMGDIMSREEVYSVPDDVLAKFDKETLKKYVNGLYLSAQEMAGEWSRGHDLLEEVGFLKVERREGHRVFVRMEWPK